ncbi:6-phosphogluconolactonase [Cnuella takakiae]|uniref:6-phosphogluconolactonase n=1 Tax=Cnuella takakiae TaxID=1302690 RepID=A0A1M4XT04_9BACT|nr:hypothetical protein BUE76_14330 [Cnuella takakiae]SHE96611.1 6-phosphogluconolactonase [Cnuella takakiae]
MINQVNRTTFFRLSLTVIFFVSCLWVNAQEVPLFVGTYTGTGSKGIYTYMFNTRTGKARLVSHTDSGSVENPSFLALAPDKQHLYAVTETGGRTQGAVSAFSVDPDGTLLFLDKVGSGGDHPCHVSVSKDGKWVMAGNYSGGSFGVFPVKGDGTLEPARQVIQHEGKGPNTARQEKAHVHATILDPANRFVFVPDLGTDKVYIYRFDGQAIEPLKEAAQPFVASAPGSGPRHFTFHPNGRFAYLMEELGGTVNVYRYQDGKLTPIQNISAHKENFTGTRGSADIHLSADGKFLYASNRGDANTIAIFSVAADGKLKWVGDQSSGGKAPRNFTLAPGGRFLLVANQDTDNVVVMKRDAVSGKLTPTGEELAVPRPVCLLFR